MNQVDSDRDGKTLSINSLNGIQHVTAAHNTDISGKISNAIAILNGTCGAIEIESGSYTWTKGNVAMLPCQTLEGRGVTITVSAPGSEPFLVIEGPPPPSPPNNNTYTPGSIRGITFAGNATPTSQTSSTGLQVGGSSSLKVAQLVSFYDIHLRNFGCGLRLAYANQLAFFGGVIEGNYDGVCFPDIVAGQEDINFHGTQILNNRHYGINQDRTGLYAEINLVSCSLDYNSQSKTSGGQVQIANGKLSILGGHLENDVLPMITMPTPGAPNLPSVNVQNVNLNLTDTDSTHSYQAFIAVKGNQPVLEIGHGVVFSSQGAGVTAAVLWAPPTGTNSNSRLTVEPYSYIYRSSTFKGLPVLTGAPPGVYSYPTYSVGGIVTGTTSSYAH